MASSYKRVDKLVDSNRILSLYKLSRQELLKAGGHDEEKREIISKNKFLQMKLTTR
jgi:hypothetical protein